MPDRNELPYNCRRIALNPRSEYIDDPDRAARAMKTGDYTARVWREIPMRGVDLPSVSYGSWSDDRDGSWFLCDALSYSDYSGTKPTYESNVRVFADMFSRGEGKWWIYANGGYDTTAIVIRTLAYRNASEVRDLIDGLADYPLIDDGDSSDLEMERESEAWEDGGRDDYKRALRAYLAKRFADRGVTHDDAGRDPDEIVDSLTDSQIDALYMQRCQDTSINGGSTCLWEGESHPHFFCNEMAFGSDASYHKEFGRDPWNGFIPALSDDGKVESDPCRNAVNPFTWIPACAWKPACPRCGKINAATDKSLWESPCDDLGCDVPKHGEHTALFSFEASRENEDRAMADLAAFILRSWDVSTNQGYNHLYVQLDTPIGAAFDKVASWCEARGDRYAALALHFRDPSERFPGLMLAGKMRKVTREVLREIVRGERPKQSYIQADGSICCVVYGSSCCEHGKQSDHDREWRAKQKWCIRSNTRGTCPVHGFTRKER